MRYAVTLTPDENGTLLVTVPDLPEALTFGEDRMDALVRAVDAIETALMAAMAAREDIAEPEASGSEHVTLPALASAKVALYQAMRAEASARPNSADASTSPCPRSIGCSTSGTIHGWVRSSAR
jgi:predicted RNase H-like HicB family nuclease